MSKISFFVLLTMLLGGNTHLMAQKSDSTKQRYKIAGFPIAYYTPETGVAVGALGLMNWNWRQDALNAKTSSVNLGFAVTSLKQILFYLPFNLFLKNDQFRLNGELGYYDYVYSYFGIGTNSGTFENKQEQFNVSFPRVRLNGLIKVRKNVFVGGQFAFDNYSNMEIEQGGLLDITRPTGIHAGTNSGLGPAFIIDSRNSVYYPRKGFYVNFIQNSNLGKWISDYAYSTQTLDISYFYSPLKKSVIAMNLNGRLAFGDVPFYQMSLLGGSKRLRGQFEGEFRDKGAIQAQIEWRQEFLKNWGFTAFFGIGSVFKNFTNFSWSNQKVGSGVGLRYKLDKKDHVNIRLDVGYGNGKIYPYLTIGEAF